MPDCNTSAGRHIIAAVTRLPRLAAAGLAVAALALAGCGGDDRESSDTGADTAPAAETTAETAEPQRAGPAPLSPDGTFQPNDLADCLLDAGVGAAVSLDGASIELHDAMSQVIIEQGNAEMLVYGSDEAAAGQEDRYRTPSGTSPTSSACATSSCSSIRSCRRT